MTRLMTAFALLASVLLTGITQAHAVPLANDMTCAQAQAYYAAHGRVYIEDYLGNVIPIYGDRACSRGDQAHPLWVRTIDTNTCVIAYRCYSNR